MAGRGSSPLAGPSTAATAEEVPDSIPEVTVNDPEGQVQPHPASARPALRPALSTTLGTGSSASAAAAEAYRPSSVRILRSRTGSADPLPQATSSRSSTTNTRVRSSTVGAPEAVGLDFLSSPPPARPNPALLRPDQSFNPSCAPTALASTPETPTLARLNSLNRARSGSEPLHSPLAAPPLEQPEDNQQSDTNNNNNDPPRLKSRRRAFTSAAIRPFQWGTSGNSNNNNTNTQPSSSDSPQSQADADASAAQQARHEQMNQRLVDFLDAVDPEIGTVSTLNNIQNSLFVPNLGSWVNRGSLIRLSTPEARAASRYSQLLDEQEKLQEKGQPTTQNRAPADVAASGANDEYAKALEEQRPPHAAASTSGRPGAQSAEPPSAEAQDAEAEKARQRAQSPLQFDDQRLQAPQPPPKTRRRGMSASSAFSGLSAPKLRHRPTVRGEFAVLPPNVDWEDWTEEEKAELDDYVRHLLHSKKEITRRKWRGFLKYCSHPLGLFVTVYSFLLFVWGLAWVLFLIGWINVGNRQAYFVEICDQILVALFALVGLGMIPWRTVDTYHMIYIAKYHRRILELRNKKGLPELCDENDLPLERPPPRLAEEGSVFGFTPEEEHVLSKEEEEKFLHHQRAFAKSHTFYRPHETETHHAFPLDLMIVAVCLLDFHSIFQLALASTTWSISYHHSYKKTLTSVILAFSLSVNITAGIVISVGDRRTRKREILEKQLIQSITQEAIERKHFEQRVARRQMEEEERKAREGLRELKQGSAQLPGSGVYTPDAVPESLVADSKEHLDISNTTR